MKGQRLKGDSPFTITKLSHVNFYYKNFDSAIHFFVTVLGFKPSDIIDSKSPHPLSTVLGNYPLCFLRLNTDHHSSALFPDLLRMRDKRNDTAIQQFSWEVQSYDQVKRGINFLKQNGVEIDFIGRRMPACNYNLYFWDPNGYRIEIAWGMEQVGWCGSKPLGFWSELRMYDKLPEGPVLPDEVESKKVRQALSTEGMKHSLDEYEVDKWNDTGKQYNVSGLLLSRPFVLTRPMCIGLVVPDVSEAVDFYTKILGFKLNGYLDGKGKTSKSSPRNKTVALLSHSGDRPSLCFYPLDAKDELGFNCPGMVVHTAFEVETLKQLQDSVAYLEDIGADIIARGRVKPAGDYVIDLKSPDGWIVRMVYPNGDRRPAEKSGPLWKPKGELK